MSDYHQELKEERVHLQKIIHLIQNEIDSGNTTIDRKKSELIATRKEMWENTVHFSNDFERMTEVSQHLNMVAHQTASYSNTRKRIAKLMQMVDSPYFGRFDFVEEGSTEAEKIYIGIHNFIDSKTQEIYVYDWRAPISSIFYQYELGEAKYKAPFGEVTGQMLLKRQYKIRNAELNYFFDCSLKINDEILQEVLSRTASSKMKHIVETIQKEQDLIIRDTENDLLIVQGVAGSGKTSIALHRVAFLMYQGLETKLSSNNIIIISPNPMFGQYISDVLPELGEENVQQTTVDELIEQYMETNLSIETRYQRIETLLTSRDQVKRELMQKSAEFKGSQAFVTTLERYLDYYERKLIEFQDIYFEGSYIATRQNLKNALLNDKSGLPLAKRLKRMENKILDQIHPLRKNRIKKIENIVENSGGHELEVPSFSRMLSMKESQMFMERLHTFTTVDPLEMYQQLMGNRTLFYKMAKGISLPENIEVILSDSLVKLREGKIPWEDAVCLLYMQIRLHGSDLFKEIKQVVVDEAQDYDPIYYEVFKLIFTKAKFTVLGDVNQSVGKTVNASIYHEIEEILDMPKSTLLRLNKSYRSSFEINRFAQQFLGKTESTVAFERHEDEPTIVHEESKEKLLKRVVLDIQRAKEEGLKSVVIICKTQQQANGLYERLRKDISVKLVNDSSIQVNKGVMITPVYLAKGLEFDGVLVYGTDDQNYNTQLDQKLLYVACTRALHRLSLYYTGEKSRLIL